MRSYLAGFVILAAIADGAVAAIEDLAVTATDLVARQRVGRVHFEYTYAATVSNQGGQPLSGVVGQLQSTSPHTEVIDGSMVVGPIGPGATVTPGDTYRIRQNRRYPFDPAALSWTFTADEPAPNTPPTANAGSDQNVAVGTAAILDGSASEDPDGDPLSFVWSIRARPSGSSADLTGQVGSSISFAPDVAGSYLIELVVSDASASSEPDEVMVTAIVDGRSSPAITSEPVTSASVGVLYSYDVEAADPDVGDTLTFALATAPAGMSIDAVTGLISWTPDSTGPADVIVEAVDSTGLSDVQAFLVLTGLGSNDAAPMLGAIADQTVPVGVTLMLLAPGVDPEGEALRYGVMQGPSGLAINSGSGLIQFTPVAGQVGSHPVVVNATDPGGQSASSGFSVTVIPETAGNAPVLDVPTDLQVNAGESVQVVFTASDADPGEVLTFSIAGAPLGAQFDPRAGTFAWIPSSADAGVLNLTVTVTDSAGDQDSAAFTITVLEPASAPVAVDDAYVIRLREVLNLPAPGVLENDFDANGDPLSTSLVEGVTVGTLDAFPGDGSLRYTPPPVGPTPVGLEQQCGWQGQAFIGEPAVGDLDGDGTTEIVHAHAFGAQGGMTVWRGSTCQVLASLLGTQPFGNIDPNHTTLVDLDGDGALEILVRLFKRGVDDTASSWAALNLVEDSPGVFSLQYLWTTEEVRDDLTGDLLVGLNGNNQDATLAVADLDGDATPELVAGFSAGAFSDRALVVVWDHQGAIEWKRWGDYQDAQSPVPWTNLVDLDLDGTLELVYHTMVLDHVGGLEFFLPVGNAGTQSPATRASRLWTTVANLDNDPYPEIFARDEIPNTYVFNHDGSVVSSGSTSTNNGGRPVTVAQLDDDPQPELVTVEFVFDVLPGSNNHLHVYEHDGSLKWRHVAGTAGSAVDIPEPTTGTDFNASNRVLAFDLERDGTDELVVFYRSGNAGTLYVVDGDGSVLIEAGVPVRARDDFMAPVIADVDDDGAAEIVHVIDSFVAAMTVLEGAAGTPLPPAPPIRNQWNFHPLFVDSAGVVADNSTPYWLRPGFNSVNKIGVVPGDSAGTVDSFTYAASDGTLASGDATVEIILTTANAPTIVSVPPTGASPGFEYRYAALATDADVGDVLTWTLVDGPDLMALDSNGVVTWNPDPGDVGTASRVNLLVTDIQGNSDNQIFTVAVSAPVNVPDLGGQEKATAAAALVDAGLSLGSVRSTYSDSVPAGQVVSQSVAAGAASAAGANIDVVLSLGPAPIFTPDLAGLSRGAAVATLEALGLTPGTLVFVNDESAAPGSVISQSGTVGALVSPGTAVDLTISGGPAATLGLARNFFGPGAGTTIQTAFFASDGSSAAVPADLVVSLEVLDNAQGAAPEIAGATVTTSADTRGSYAVRMSSVSAGVDLASSFTVSRDAASDGVQAAYAEFGAQLNEIAATVDALNTAVLDNDVMAIGGLGAQLAGQRAALDLDAVRQVEPMVLETGFIPLTPFGTPNTVDDVVFPQALSAAIAEVESSRSFLVQLVAGSGRNDDVRSIVLNQRLDGALTALASVTAGPRGFAANRAGLHQLMSDGLPGLLAEDLDRVLAELASAGLLARRSGGLQELYAERSIGPSGSMRPAFFSLGGLMSATRIRTTLIKKFYVPNIRRLVGIAAQTAFFANASGADYVQEAEGVITGASLSLHLFNAGNSALETSWGSEYPGGMEFRILGPDYFNGWLDYLAALNSARTANSRREQLAAVRDAINALRAVANSEQELRVDETIRGCILSLDPDCGQLVFYDGFPVVHSIGSLPAPVMFQVRTLGTGVVTTFLANFFPGRL